MSQKILLVDDDDHVLRGYQRRLNDQFEVETAPGGPEALAVIAAGPFAVVVADMRMPVMDGVQFLSRVKEVAPNTVRMMLTGNADMQTAIDAVNKGNIFRFLTKPCPPEIFTEALQAGLKQYQLITAERELLDGTLNGSIKVLIEILSLANPSAFSRANRIARLVGQMATELQAPNVWQYKLAAMLSQIGCITLPPGVLDKINTKVPLTPVEQNMYAVHPAVGYQLLVNIPRLKLIAKMIERQFQAAGQPVLPQNLKSEDDVILFGAQLLKVALDFDDLLTRGVSYDDAVEMLKKCPNTYNPNLLTALVDHAGADAAVAPPAGRMAVNLKDLKTGMIIVQDVWAKNGILLVQNGQTATLPVLVRLRNFADGVGIDEPIMVSAASA